jgi:hypothetical protein
MSVCWKEAAALVLLEAAASITSFLSLPSPGVPVRLLNLIWPRYWLQPKSIASSHGSPNKRLMSLLNSGFFVLQQDHHHHCAVNMRVTPLDTETLR